MRYLQFSLIIILILIFSCLLWLNSDDIKRWESSLFDQKKALEVTFFDVGQGDATWLEFSNGEQMLVDCSKDRRVLKRLGNELWFFDQTIDYLVVTHPDYDHYGGCIDVLRKYEVENIIYNGVKRRSSKYWQTFDRFYHSENANYVTISSPQKLTIGSSTLHFFYPDRNLSKINGQQVKFEQTNNTSLIFKITKGESGILFTGDAEKKLERYITNKYPDQLDAEVYKMGHHGSAGSSNIFFIEKIKPKLSIASAGKNNSFGHPAFATITRLKQSGSMIARTDTDGNIKIKLFVDRFRFRSNTYTSS